MACIFTSQAEKDLENIADYIALDNPARAMSFIGEMKARCRRILRAPRGYPFVPEYGDTVRKAHFGTYLILYTIQADDVVILDVIHSARDFFLER